MAPSLSDTEQEMLCSLYKWEDMAIILQEETRLTPGENKPFRWTKLKGMSDDAVIKALPDDNMGVILVVHFSEMGQLKEVSKSLLQVARVDRLDLLIIMEDDKALFPTAGPQIEKAVPWHINDLRKLNRPLQTRVAPDRAEKIAWQSTIRSGNSQRQEWGRYRLRSQYPNLNGPPLP